ncbi:MAG: YggS family pyridoxal phosphate-dependent enzyme [Proteobacteria bacterium]|nr:YggS family pyridoxal phosphate-dependent enzyme [Pseudomonadota bacterium]
MTSVTQNLLKIRQRIRQACDSCGRDPAEVNLLAVSKKHPADAIRVAFEAGQKAFGENFVQEAMGKQRQLQSLDIEWHFIGHIQSNKAREIATCFDWVHSVDRLKVATKLSAHRPPGQTDLDICLQVALNQEKGKSGVAPENLADLASRVAELPGLRLRGLMCIPPASEKPSRQRHWFARLASLQNELNQLLGLGLDTLSMGMSNDLEAAIEEGSTLVRLGTAVFGPRPAGTGPLTG